MISDAGFIGASGTRSGWQCSVHDPKATPARRLKIALELAVMRSGVCAMRRSYGSTPKTSSGRCDDVDRFVELGEIQLMHDALRLPL
jgi:hypothetical protein